MGRVRTFFEGIYQNPYRYASYVMSAGGFSLIFITPEYESSCTKKQDDNMLEWLLIYAVIYVTFYDFVSSLGNSGYNYFNIWYLKWLLMVALYHLPDFHSIGADIRMNLSSFLTISILANSFLIVLHLFRGPKRLTLTSLIDDCIFLWAIGIRISPFALVGSGSAGDNPLHSKPGESSDETSHPYSCSNVFILLAIINFAVEILTGLAFIGSVPQPEEPKPKPKPKFLDMVPWYSWTSPDLYKTVYGILVSVTVFLGRFDMRAMQATMNDSHDGARQEDFLYDHFSEKKEFWFDFMADTGDGGNSSYSVARLLAQPSLDAREDDSSIELPRGDLLLIGGDLAYPNPSTENYEKRFFYPFEKALQPPLLYKKEHIAVNKPELPDGYSGLKEYDGPQCFVIPGNHDWFDGLQTFMRYICHKSWLGGWLMPQKKSYFALQLPEKWWVFGLDQALHSDIDIYQFKFFSELIRNKVQVNDCVIIMTHAPSWILDSYCKDVTEKNVSYLIRDHLKGRCKLRIAGDLHHYMRHECQTSTNNTASMNCNKAPEHLLVNGCGGAFLHPTHVFSNDIEAYNSTYKCALAYPTFEHSRKIARENLWNFRKSNWQFDIIGGSIYFILTFSMFPMCKLDHSLQDITLFSVAQDAFMYTIGESYVSLVGALILSLAAIFCVPSKVSMKKRIIIGVLHVSAHIVSAFFLMLLMESIVCIGNKLLVTPDYHSLNKPYQTAERNYFLYPRVKARIEQWIFGLYFTVMSALDLPQVMAVTRTDICKNVTASPSRGSALKYYASVFPYFWVLSTPAVSMVLGRFQRNGR